MAFIDADRIFFHDANDLESFERFYSSRPGDDRSVRGEIHQAASGRLRTIVRVGANQTIGVTLRDVSQAQLDWLDARTGALLLYRDPRGRFLFGSYFSLGVDEYTDGSGYDVALTFGQTTRTIEV